VGVAPGATGLVLVVDGTALKAPEVTGGRAVPCVVAAAAGLVSKAVDPGIAPFTGAVWVKSCGVVVGVNRRFGAPVAGAPGETAAPPVGEREPG